jgi:hypothetical protein
MTLGHYPSFCFLIQNNVKDTELRSPFSGEKLAQICPIAELVPISEDRSHVCDVLAFILTNIFLLPSVVLLWFLYPALFCFWCPGTGTSSDNGA